MLPKKSLGQHFLRCRWVAQTMIKAADLNHSDTVLEIGPGTGVLTRELSKYAGRVIAVEKDERLAEELTHSSKKTGTLNVDVVAGDILNLWRSNFHKLMGPDRNNTKYKVVSNIPYYLTSRLIRLLLESDRQPETIILTIQKEVAQRITAGPPKLSLLAFSVQFFGKPEVLKIVPRNCFYPEPSVDSAIIKISGIGRQASSETNWNKIPVFKIAKTLFAKKRKTVLNNLSSLVKKSAAAEILKKSGVLPQRRAEELSIHEIVRIAEKFN